MGDGTTIAGLDEGIRGMREGGYRRFLIPPPIAYQEGLAKDFKEKTSRQGRSSNPCQKETT